MAELISGLSKYTIDTPENWTTINPILPKDVLCFEFVLGVYNLKIGDGINTWNNTPYFTDQPDVLANYSTLGVVSRAVLDEIKLGLEDTKYISPALLLSHLQTANNGDTIILSPGSTIYREVTPETYINNTDYPPLRPYGAAEPENGGLIPDVAFRMEHPGSATLSFEVRKGRGDTEIRLCKNQIELMSWISSHAAYRTNTYNISFVPGDIIALQARESYGSSDGRVRNIRLLISPIS